MPCGTPKGNECFRVFNGDFLEWIKFHKIFNVFFGDFEQQINWCHMPPLNLTRVLGLKGELVVVNWMLPCHIYHCGSNFKVLRVEFVHPIQLAPRLAQNFRIFGW